MRLLALVPAAVLAAVSSFAAPLAMAQSVNSAPATDLVADPCQSVTSGVPGGGGARNMILVHNPSGGDLRVRGSVQLNHIQAMVVGPVNCAAALNGTPGQLAVPTPSLACVGCASLAVALQIDLVNRNANRETPRNVARAQNLRCQGCTAIALAIQYVLPVDDPAATPADATSLARNLDQQLRELQSDHDVTATVAADRVISVIRQFNALASELNLQRSDAAN